MYSVDLLVDIIKTQALEWGRFADSDVSVISVILSDFILYLEEVQPSRHYHLYAVHIPTGRHIDIQGEVSRPEAPNELHELYTRIVQKINS